MATRRSGIKRILVGADGSEHGQAAVEWAARMAKGMGSEVIAVFAIAPTVYFDTAFNTPAALPEYDMKWRAEMARELERDWCKPLRIAKVKYRAVIEDGRPASVLAERADKVDADVIVVGRRGRGGIAELLLGSVSHELVLHSKRPVFVVSSAEPAATKSRSARAPRASQRRR
jgi:nucleotide-binding universal stress UspA family protein